MPSEMKTCEDYRAAMTDAAAAAVEPSLELRTHLDACASCHAAFAEETQFFAAIDSGLRAAASAEVPASFFPRVRAGLEGDSASQRSWAPSLIFAAAGVAMVLTVFIATHLGHTIGDNRAKQSVSAPSHEPPEIPVRREATGIPVIVAANGSHHTLLRRNSTPTSSASSTPLEVLVSPEEREAFARFVSMREERRDVVIALVAAAPDTRDGPLSVEPLLIAKLKVKPLEQLENGAPDSTQEEQE
jgi:hypothetical protein